VDPASVGGQQVAVAQPVHPAPSGERQGGTDGAIGVEIGDDVRRERGAQVAARKYRIRLDLFREGGGVDLGDESPVGVMQANVVARVVADQGLAVGQKMNVEAACAGNEITDEGAWPAEFKNAGAAGDEQVPVAEGDPPQVVVAAAVGELVGAGSVVREDRVGDLVGDVDVPVRPLDRVDGRAERAGPVDQVAQVGPVDRAVHADHI